VMVETSNNFPNNLSVDVGGDGTEEVYINEVLMGLLL